MLLVSYALAQNAPTTLQNIMATPEGTNLRVEITLSSPVKPMIETATHPRPNLARFTGYDLPRTDTKRHQS